MLLMRPEREMSPSSEEFMLRVGSCTSAEERAGISGKLGREKVSDGLSQTQSQPHAQSSGT